jgi:predicted phage terminase large subunit-like protein
MQHPRATGIVFRRTNPMLKSPGSIWQEAVALYSSIFPKGLKIKNREMEIIFPNGALLKFSHMQHETNMFDHKGGQYSLVIWDEATDFSEGMITYLLSRMRNAYVDYKPQMFLMTNPSYDSFLRHWIQDYYLDHTGVPIKERAGHKRYFVRQGDQMIWENDRQKLVDIYGENSGITSFTFIGANCLDNPPLLKARPDYVEKLKAMGDIQRAILFDGNWFAREEAAGYFKRDWVTEVDFPNENANKRVRAWDLASSPPSSAYPDPDWSRGTLMSRDKHGVITVEDVESLRDRPHVVKQRIFDAAKKDGADTTIILPLDPGASAGAYVRELAKELSDSGYHVKLVKPEKAKVQRFKPFSSIAEARFVQVVKADWNKEFYDELEAFGGTTKKMHDDFVDTCSDAYLILSKTQVLPEFSLPDFSAPNAFASASAFN